MRPLQGVRVLAVEQYGAGPFGTQFLSDLGAEVIKIENPADGGDVARSVGPYFHPDLPQGADSIFFQGLNRGKKSLSLDIARPEGRAIFRRLVARADAVASNLRGDVPGRLGITYAQLADANPKIVCAHLTGYGRDGERRNWPGYDYLMQAETGYFHLTGEPDSPPARAGLSLIDLMSGAVMGLGLVSAVLAARTSGRGQDVDVSLFDVSLFNLNYIGNWYLNAGANTRRTTRSAHPSLTPCQTYRTGDGWIYLMCNKEKFWGVLCRKVGHPEWIDDPRFLRFPDRLKNRDLITQLLDAALSTRSTAEWLAEFAGAVPAAPILDVAQALENDWARAGGRIESVSTAGAPLQRLAAPIRLGGTEGGDGVDGPLPPGPVLGADTESLLAEIGIGPTELARLREEGVA